MASDAIKKLLPSSDIGRLKRLSTKEIALAFLQSQKAAMADKATAIKCLSDVCDAEAAIASAIEAKWLREEAGLLASAPDASGAEAFRIASGDGWLKAQRALALFVLSTDATKANGPAGRPRPDLGAVALRQLYALNGLPASPSRQDVRCEFLRFAFIAQGSLFKEAASSIPRGFKFDALSRRLYLSIAGIESGTILQADAALLEHALGMPAATMPALSQAIIKLALQEKAPVQELKGKAFDLEDFAHSVQKLARTLETKPYAGRVAIAQVYDAGLARGLDLGSLDDFKDHVAEAAREGLIDLERYDIAGPFDPSLRERSRLRLGRDERHFIVNQWI